MIMKTDAAIAVEALTKSYKNNRVLKGVDFAVRRGRVFALLGSNGAGKTTTIRILSTLILPDGGRAEIMGHDVVREARSVQRKISLTGQYAAVDEMLTGRENLHLIGSLRRLKNVRALADELLVALDLAQAADQRVSAYSGGMRRKIDLAAGIIGNPPVLFLDEPTTGLDPQSRLSLWKTIQSLSRSGTTIFLSTQYLEEAERLADDIAILDKGVIVAHGSVAELKKTLPSGCIEFSFEDRSHLQRADAALRAFKRRTNDEAMTLAVTADDSIEQLAAVLNLLKAEGIPVSRFEQKLPTLEDVFLTHIDHDREQVARHG